MATAAEREIRELKELNLALAVLRRLANKEGYVEGSPVELIHNALRGEISLSRVRDLVTTLGRLGWREEAWIGSGNVRGSKIVMQPEKIDNLEILPAKVERKKFEEEVAEWFRSNFEDIMGSWTVRNPHRHREAILIALLNYHSNRPRGQKSHWIFSFDKTGSLPEWFGKMLTPDGKLADATLYRLWKAGNAQPHSK